MSSKAKYLLTCCIIMAPVMFATIAEAQTSRSVPEQAEPQNDEILVTANRRSESLASVPISMSVLNDAVIEQKAITSFIDYGTSVPNLSFGSSNFGSAGARTVSIRGVQGIDVTGFYLDETPVPDSIDPKIVDVERIEVLRGPQGTLYGARSMGGTVRILTKQPELGVTSGAIHVGASYTKQASNPNFLADAVINLPLAENLAFRASGYISKDAGYFTRSFFNPVGSSSRTSVKDVNRIVTKGLLASLLWEPTDRLTIKPKILLQATNFNGFPYSYITTTLGVPTVYKPTSFEQDRVYNIPEGGYDRYALYSLGLHYRTDIGEFVSSTSYFHRGTHEVEDGTESFNGLFIPPDVTPLPISFPNYGHFKRFVQEARFASELKGPFQFVTGVYYSHTSDTPLDNPPVIVPGFEDAAYPGSIPVPPLVKDEFFAARVKNVTNEYAAYGEASFNITEKLKVTAGVRGYIVKITGNDWAEGILFTGTRTTSPEARLTEKGISPKFQVNYQFDRDNMVYATVSRGFRPGGTTPAISETLCGANLASLGVTAAQVRSYQFDSLWNYEVGGKLSFLDRRLTLNGAAYKIKWKNLQQPVAMSCGFFFTTNAGAAESTGFELDSRLKISDELTVSGGVGYADAKITASSPASPVLVGQPVRQVPKWTWNADATYSRDLGSDRHFTANVAYAFTGSSFSTNNDPFTLRLRPSYGLLSTRIAVEWSNYELALVGKNLTNVHANLSDSKTFAPEVPGRVRVVTNQPRTLGMEFRAKF